MTQPKAPWKCYTTKTPYPLLTREQVIAIVGEAKVDEVEASNDYHIADGLGLAAITVVGARVPVTELQASVEVNHPDYDTLVSYCYARTDWLDNPNVDGWDNLDWQPYGYGLK